jgi:peptidoglycan/xylan/chitin deacetylase (PgdA/CDA1 family)
MTQATFPGAGCGALDETRSATRYLRDLARLAIYWSGALSLYHRLRNRRVLTVVVFHRVLRRNDARWETALSPWTLDDDTFGHCLAFFKRHYTVITLGDVKASLEGKTPLPSRSLLITFDDGYADNFDYALPLLRKHGAPATVFITSDVIGREERLWTEDLLWTFLAGRIRQRKLSCLHALLLGGRTYNPDDPQLIWDIVRRGPGLAEQWVHAALSGLNIDLRRIKHPRQMLTRDQIGNLAVSGLSVGAHGKTHTALPFSSDIATELRWPRAVLSDILAAYGHGSVDALSFPHGAYTPEIVDEALAAGYTLLFTGDAELCVLRNGFLVSPLLGRIDVDERRIAPRGRFRPEVLATSLFTAPRRRPRAASRGVSTDGRQPAGPILTSRRTDSLSGLLNLPERG